eukprot:1151750-Pelagomonas_calceolata.AAC.2
MPFGLNMSLAKMEALLKKKIFGLGGYLSLNLSRNPLASQGVINISKGIACCPTLKVLNLSSVDLTEEHVVGLEFLCGALSANPSIDQVDLDCNFFGVCKTGL